MQEGFSFRIFLVDDDLFSLAMYEQHFRNLGCSNYYSFNSIAQCVSRLDEKPHVIFLDYRTNPEKGLKILSAVKKTIPEAYIVFITGPSGTLESLFSLKYGAFEYIIRGAHHADALKGVLKRIERMEKIAYKKP